jgi:hypothetical protein
MPLSLLAVERSDHRYILLSFRGRRAACDLEAESEMLVLGSYIFGIWPLVSSRALKTYVWWVSMPSASLVGLRCYCVVLKLIATLNK